MATVNQLAYLGKLLRAYTDEELLKKINEYFKEELGVKEIKSFDDLSNSKASILISYITGNKK